jgi:hypothetical protein
MPVTISGTTGGIGLIGSLTATTPSSTSLLFTGIPSGVKRLTILFKAVLTSGTSDMLVRIGSGSITTSGYVSSGGAFSGSNGTGINSSTTGFLIREAGGPGFTVSGTMTIATLGSNVWVSSSIVKGSAAQIMCGGGDVTLSGDLDRVNFTMVNGTDTFTSGSINILYE